MCSSDLKLLVRCRTSKAVAEVFRRPQLAAELASRLLRPGSSQAASVSRLSLHYGRRGQPVQKPRFMPLLKAQAVARKLQARHIGLVAVL